MNIKNIRHICISSFFLLLGTALLLPMLSSQRQAEKNELLHPQVISTMTTPVVPREIIFAGETIDLSRSDLRERIDREFISFTYSHTNTLLTIKRANRLFPVIEPLLKKYGMPDDLKYLMVIESNLDIRAKSPAGAAGLWQFIESTGRKYGLEINTYIDERYNTKKATKAACRYLKDSYDMFGDWLTVAASYNAGQAGISRQLKEQEVVTATDLWLNSETSRYIFRLLAAKEIFSSPQRYGFLLREVDLYPPIPSEREIRVDTTIENLPRLAREYHLTYSQLIEANPWLTDKRLPNKSRRTYILEIPDSAALHYNPKETKAHNRAWVVD